MLKQFLQYFLALFCIVPNLYSTESEIFVSKNLPDSPDPEISYTQFIVNDLYEHQRTELSKSSIYFFITAYKQEKFAENLARSLELNYARLCEFGVNFQIRLTCDGRTEDYEAFKRAFSIHIIPETNFIISLNESNKGCSLTRYEQLCNSREEIMKDIASGRNVYFSIFDGDDMIHQDYCLLMLALALGTKAETIGVTQLGLQCYEEDTSKINTLQTKSILEKSLQYEPANDSDFTPILFKASVLYNDIFDFKFSAKYHGNTYPIDPLVGFFTLSPLLELYKGARFSISDKGFYQEQSRGLFGCADTSIDMPAEFLPMFYYMQHSGSMMHNGLKETLKVYSGLLTGKNLEIVLSIIDANDIFLFGISDYIDSEYTVTSDKNITVTEEFLINSFKNNHKLAHAFKETITESDNPYVLPEETNQRIKYILEHPKMQELLAQDVSKSLSDEFVKTFYKDIFDMILGKKPLPKIDNETIEEVITSPVSSEIDQELQRKLASGEYIPPVEYFLRTKKGEIPFIEIVFYPEHDVITTPRGEKISIPHEDIIY